jgi:hypothetical protein
MKSFECQKDGIVRVQKCENVSCRGKGDAAARWWSRSQYVVKALEPSHG